MKIVYVSSILPSGHFAQYYTNALNQIKGIEVFVYTDKNLQNLQVKNCGIIKLVWHKNFRFLVDILINVIKDKPHLIHIQQEFNMYGGIITVAFFPLLLLLLKLTGNKSVVTIHSAVFKHQVTKDFISLFTSKRSILLTPFTLKLFFYYTYWFTSLFADKIICHTNLLKNILVSDWSVDSKKVSVIPTGIPKKNIVSIPKEHYFFYFGYMVRRKGLEYALQGFQQFIKKNPSYKLILAGGTIKGQEDAVQEIKQYISQLKLNRHIEIKGFVEESELDDLYSKSLAVIIPAKVSMGSSGPLYQAQSYGKCIVASSVGHFKEDIQHLYDGILVDNKKWEKAFEFVVKNPQIVGKIERNVKNKARNKSSLVIAQKHLKVYKTITDESNS